MRCARSFAYNCEAKELPFAVDTLALGGRPSVYLFNWLRVNGHHLCDTSTFCVYIIIIALHWVGFVCNLLRSVCLLCAAFVLLYFRGAQCSKLHMCKSFSISVSRLEHDQMQVVCTWRAWHEYCNTLYSRVCVFINTKSPASYVYARQPSHQAIQIVIIDIQCGKTITLFSGQFVMFSTRCISTAKVLFRIYIGIFCGILLNLGAFLYKHICRSTLHIRRSTALVIGFIVKWRVLLLFGGEEYAKRARALSESIRQMAKGARVVWGVPLSEHVLCPPVGSAKA